MENLSLYQTIILAGAVIGVYVRFNLLVNKQDLEIAMMKEQMKDMKAEHSDQMKAIKDSIDALLKSVKHIELTLAKKQIT
jgi:predicted tellurium resistance membrane protein TerC